jgi:hypothetical protein
MSAQPTPERMDDSDHVPDACVLRWARHQVASTWAASPPELAQRFVAFQEALPSLRRLQTTAVAQPIACGHVAPLDGFGCVVWLHQHHLGFTHIVTWMAFRFRQLAGGAGDDGALRHELRVA